ncbi:hypothetical protein ETAA8_35980 [Anatilimnocola aggregata]|uniref:Secreted protein n=1 Tax=Anatilimnocola aggregata TaxID=2528021 RepID=A0A517YE62_9BACT|nr:hypothetical protein [Anatilimnocola aggregata]QDU28497.1 hypothetical protein ETAA8_35980 [Anatilimnocola aggregata]
MKQTIVKIGTLGLLLCTTTLPARADWFNYVVRTSGLGWSSGYHAYDQCPPRPTHGHFPIKHPFAMPGYEMHSGLSSGAHAPYYFEEQAPSTPQPAPTPAEPLPSAPSGPMSERLPDPQARYQPRSRYFEALQAEQQQAYPQQTATRPQETRQARRPSNAPPF